MPAGQRREAQVPEDVKKPDKGSVYLRGGTFWVKYYKWGKPYRESAKTNNEDKALRFLKFKLKQIELGRFVEPKLERTSVSELWEPFLRDLRLYKRKDISHVEKRWQNHLEPVFADMRALDVTKTRLLEYVDQRQKEGAETSTIARELAVLKRMFRLGYSAEPKMVTTVPSFPKLQECTPRQGFLADADYPKLANECAREGLWLRALLSVAYNFGWRKSELLNLRVRQVDLALRAIRLDAGSTKNNDSREVTMTQEVFTLLSACVHGKQPEDYVFTRKDGKRVKDFRKTWADVCERAGVPGLLLHDLRRTGARNLRRLGVDQKTIMEIGGWKTAAIFSRYNITDPKDRAEAAQRLDEKLQAQADSWAQFGHNLTTAPASGKLTN